MTFTKDPSTHPANGPLTEERLNRVRDELAAAAKRSDGGNLGYMMADAAKAIDEVLAMRKMKQEPVAWQWLYRDKRHVTNDPARAKFVAEDGDVNVQPLYAAPQLPQPAVISASEGALKSLLPDAEKSEFLFEHNGKIFFEGVRFNNAVFEACHAAMLQDAEPVQRWIPCSERMPDKGQEVLCTDQFDNYETALYDTGYIPGPPFFATTAGEFHPTHWMPLPAAPQQEVK